MAWGPRITTCTVHLCILSALAAGLYSNTLGAWFAFDDNFAVVRTVFVHACGGSIGETIDVMRYIDLMMIPRIMNSLRGDQHVHMA